jgi:hypothetical protein
VRERILCWRSAERATSGESFGWWTDEMSTVSTRRNLLQGAGVLAAAAAAHVTVTRASAQGIQDRKGKPVTDELNIIDWHCHHVPARFELTALSMAPPANVHAGRRSSAS